MIVVMVVVVVVAIVIIMVVHHQHIDGKKNVSDQCAVSIDLRGTIYHDGQDFDDGGDYCGSGSDAGSVNDGNDEVLLVVSNIKTQPVIKDRVDGILQVASWRVHCYRDRTLPPEID